MDKYKVAIVIPCWNSSMFIKPMLDSVLRQTFTDFRVICVDDQSEDNTFSILQEYAKKDNRINAICRNRLPKGAPTCRNIGFDYSESAEYVIWFDSDDIISPYCIEQRVNFMDSHPDLDFACFKAKTFKNDPSETENVYLFGYEYPFADDLSRTIRRNNPFGGWELIHRRGSLLKNDIQWDERLLSYQDVDLILQLFKKGLTYAYAKESKIDYFYRIGYRPYSITLNKFTDADKASDLYFINKLYNNLTTLQRQKYSYDIDGYILNYVALFYKDNTFIRKLLQLDLLKEKKWFTFRIKICCQMLKLINKRKARHLFFPLNYLYRINDDKNYRKYRSNQLKMEIERGFSW